VWAAVPHLADSRGYALLLASIASFVPLPGAASYAASKAGVDSLAASLRLELAQYGVDVGTVHPSWIDTDLVRKSEADLPSFKKFRAQLPWPANTTTSVEVCARALAGAVASRAARTFVPKQARLLASIRALSLAPGPARLLAKRISPDLNQMDVENQALGATWR
jgi:short-subunit dehydrogenase